MKSEYSARVDALEARIQQLEAANAAAADASLAAAAARTRRAVEPAPSAPGGSASAFNPAISLILGGSFTGTSRDPADWHIARLRSAPATRSVPASAASISANRS